MSSTESRLAAVERQLRFHRAVIAALLVALVALMGYGATEGVPEEIRARKFVVVNEDGRNLLVLDSHNAEGHLGIYEPLIPRRRRRPLQIAAGGNNNGRANAVVL